jgi:hypothetical protein
MAVEILALTYRTCAKKSVNELLTKPIDQWEEGRPKKEGKQESAQNIAILEQPRWQRSVLLLPELDPDKNQDEQSEPNEEADDARVIPRVSRPAPLQRQDQADNGGNQDGQTGQIELADALYRREAIRVVGAIDL